MVEMTSRSRGLPLAGKANRWTRMMGSGDVMTTHGAAPLLLEETECPTVTGIAKDTDRPATTVAVAVEVGIDVPEATVEVVISEETDHHITVVRQAEKSSWRDWIWAR